jgi:hypothetical protein
MRNLFIVFGVAAITLGAAACAYNPQPVPVYASRADWEILAGHWRGSYTTSPSGRWRRTGVWRRPDDRRR